MTGADLGEKFKRFVADAANTAAFGDHLSTDFTYSRWGSDLCFRGLRHVDCWEYQDLAHAELTDSPGKIEIDMIYVDADRRTVIACIRFVEANRWHAEPTTHGVWIAQFNAEAHISRLEDYSDSKFFDCLLLSSAEP